VEKSSEASVGKVKTLTKILSVLENTEGGTLTIDMAGICGGH
jgi:hypothetical protein